MSNDPSLDWRDYPVSSDLASLRFDVGVQVAGIVLTRSQAAKMIKAGDIRINGKAAKPSYLLQNGDRISARVKVKTPEEIEPYDFPIPVLYEDDWLIIVNKPAGLVVHPSAGHPNKTLINALVFRNTDLSHGFAPYRPGLVHRIDKGTSGLLVLAKNNEAHIHLARQFKNRTVGRQYLALAYPAFRTNQGRIESQLGRDPSNRKRFSVVPEGQGKNAITNYQVLQENANMALVALRLETGRTHQIRVHLKHLGHPIMGDDLYDGQKRAKNFKNLKLRQHILNMSRFALHAKTLSFTHPKTNKRLSYDCQLPDELAQLAELGGIKL